MEPLRNTCPNSSYANSICLHFNMNIFTSLHFDGRKLVSAIYRIFQGKETILVVVNRGENRKTIGTSPPKRAHKRPEENITQSKSNHVPTLQSSSSQTLVLPTLQSLSSQTLVPVNLVPVLQFRVHPKILKK